MVKEIKKELFVNVYGYDDVKRELSLVKSWLTDEKLINNPKLMIPKGILFYGRPGCGKTLMLREYAKSFNCPVYIIEGKIENTCEEISETFSKAREKSFAIVCIDEIDLLINRSNKVERTLQQELDGINNAGKILVLATTNNINELPSPLLRPGRFDKHINFSAPDKESRKQIFINFINDLGIPLENIDIDHVAKVCCRCNGSEIKAVCNDAFLRCKYDVNTEEIETSYRRVVYEDFEDKTINYKDMRVAIHEAGHSLMALNFKDNWSFYNAIFTESGGMTEVQEIDEKVDTIKKREQNIMISLSGFIAEEVYYGAHDVGSFDDYQKAQDLTTRLIERVCVKGIYHLIPSYSNNLDRYESSKKRNKNELLVKKLINKYSKQVRKFLLKNYLQLEHFANLMYQNGKITYKDTKNIVLNH